MVGGWPSPQWEAWGRGSMQFLGWEGGVVAGIRSQGQKNEGESHS